MTFGKEMRTLGFSFLTLLNALIFGVFGHHMLTTDRASIATGGLAAGSVVGVITCFAVMTAAKTEEKLALRVLAASMLIIAGCVFFDSLRSQLLPVGYRIASLVAGAVPALFGIIVLVSSKKAPNQPSQPTRSARG